MVPVAGRFRLDMVPTLQITETGRVMAWQYICESMGKKSDEGKVAAFHLTGASFRNEPFDSKSVIHQIREKHFQSTSLLSSVTLVHSIHTTQIRRTFRCDTVLWYATYRSTGTVHLYPIITCYWWRAFTSRPSSLVVTEVGPSARKKYAMTYTKGKKETASKRVTKLLHMYILAMQDG